MAGHRMAVKHRDVLCVLPIGPVLVEICGLWYCTVHCTFDWEAWMGWDGISSSKL